MTDTANELAQAKVATNLAAELERLSAAATGGTWLAARRSSIVGRGIVASPEGRMIGNIVDHEDAPANAELIVALRNAVPEIIAAIKAAETPLPDVAGLVEEARHELWIFGRPSRHTITKMLDALEALARQIAERDAEVKRLYALAKANNDLAKHNGDAFQNERKRSALLSEALSEAVDVLDGMNDDEINEELMPRLRRALEGNHD